MTSRPLMAVVMARYSNEPGLIPIAADMAGWIVERGGDRDRVLAEAMYSTDARDRLVRMYCLERAQDECAALPDSYFLD
jgi:hypothetical protein